jgi:glutathione reductase (NADPH)
LHSPTFLFWVARHPTIGTVGLTESQARAKYGDTVKICAYHLIFYNHPFTHDVIDKSTFKALYFSMIEEEHKEPTMYKLVVVGPEERVVGVHIIGLGSDEVMQGFGVAVKMGGECVFCFVSWFSVG